MVASKNMLLGLWLWCLFTGAMTKNIRGLEGETARKLASSGSKCWSWCSYGRCSWSWRGCQCICYSNYEGACCNDMKLCGPEKDACPQDMLTSRSVDVSSLLDRGSKFRSDVGPRVQSQGPAALRGLFWLTEQEASSSLVSFARSYDGGDMGQGKLNGGSYAMSIRVGGDRCWSFADAPGGNFETVGLLDLVYHFRLVSGSLADPTGFKIIPEARNLGIALSGRLGEWMLEFSMSRLSADQAIAAGFPGSVVWDRVSALGGKEVKSARYLAVQIVDGDSNPIEPAYSKWVSYMNSADAGNSPGKIHYREALTNDGSL